MIRVDMSEEFVKSGKWLVTMPERDKYLKQIKVLSNGVQVQSRTTT
tara:strand:- start:6141 stop:6278 length:138 start_codon:yes stop_codon:yes gene_type:complete